MPTIESPEVIEAVLSILKEVGTKLLPWKNPAVTADNYEQLSEKETRRFYKRLKEVGYFQHENVPRPADMVNAMGKMVDDFRAGRINQQNFAELCQKAGTGTRDSLIDFIERIRQEQSGEPIIGYKPSPRLVKAREALALYRQAHRELHSETWHKGIPSAHTPLVEKLAQTVKAAGFEDLAEFHKLNEVLP